MSAILLSHCRPCSLAVSEPPEPPRRLRPMARSRPPAAEVPLHRALGLTDDEADAIAADPRAAAQPPRAGHVRGDVVGALLVQVVPDPPAPPAHRGAARAGRPGRGRRGGRRRRRHRGRLPHREPQPPVRHRALPGRRHRASAASSAMCSRSAPGRSPSWIRSDSVRWTTPAAAGSPRAWCPAFPDMATRSACPPSAARPCSTPPIRTTRSSTCSASGVLPHRAARAGPGVRRGQPGRAVRLVHRPRRDRRGQRAGVGGLRARRATTTSDRACRSATPSRRSG